MGRRERRRYRCPGCGWLVRSVVPAPWCAACKRHAESPAMSRVRARDPEREARILTHIARVEREMPREGTTDPLNPFSSRAL
jgi:hypothetical protein